MNKLLTKTKEFIFTQQTSIFSSTLILAGMMIVSRIAGFVRYRILTGIFTPEQLDVFLAAFKIPDLVFEVLITGALGTTFIPYFIKYQRRPDDQNSIMSSIMNYITLFLLGFIALLAIFIPHLMPLIGPGFEASQREQIILFSRILLIGQLPFFVMGNFLTGISQAKKSFLIPAIVPIVYNIAIILFTLFLAPSLSLLAPVIGVVAGAILFFIIQLPILWFGTFRYQFSLKNKKETAEFLRMALPRIMTTVVAQIEATIDLSLTSLIGKGAYTIFSLAQHLQLLPVSIIGIAFGQASLPYLTETYQDKKYKEFKKIITDSILNIFYLTIPFASFFIIAQTPIVRLFFGGDKFDWVSTVQTAQTLAFFCISVPLHAIYYLLIRCFYATFDTKTPFYTSIFAIGMNAILSLVFVLLLKQPVWSLSLAFSISMTIHVLLLLYLLYKKLDGIDVRGLLFETTKIIVATFNTSVIVYFLLKVLDGLIFDTTRTINVFLLLVVCSICYAGLYLMLTWLFGIREMYLLTRMLLKFREYQKKLVEMYQGVQ